MRNFFARMNGGSGAFAAAAVCLVLIAAGFWVQSKRDVDSSPQQAALLVPQSDQPTAEVKSAETPEVQADTDAPKPVLNETSKVETATAVAIVAKDKPIVNEPAEPEAVPEAAAVPKPEAEPTQATAQDNVPAPAFDEVRREPDGMTVIAGRAAPGAEVIVLQDGVEIARTTADGLGKFATLAMIAPDGQGHLLSLRQSYKGGEKASDDEIILAPLAQTVVVANEPEAVVSPDVTAEVAEESTSQDGESVKEAVMALQQQASEDKAEAIPSTVVAADQVTAGTPDKVVAALEPSPSETPATPSATHSETSAPEQPAKPAPVAILKSTVLGVELLNTPSPEAMTNVAIDTISYSDVGEVQLAGRAQSVATSVRVYLDNDSVVNLPVDEQGRWRGELPDVDEGLYTLRVDEVSAAGKVTSRVETPFKREATEVLIAAAAGQNGPLKAITVQKGATLWAIARERYGDGQLYVRVFEANNGAIRDPDLIYPGQVFDLPD